MRLRAAAAALAAATLATSCGGGASPGPAAAPPPVSPSTPVPVGTAPAGIDLAVRGAAADAFARARGGRTGIVVRDRVTGQVWRNGDAGTAFRAASTVKLALAADLLARTRAAGRTLGARDRATLTAMIVSSDNAAADRVWAGSGGAGTRLGAYGLSDASGTGSWGGIRCTPDDLDRLMAYVLGRSDPADRATLVGLLRGVVPAQRWGVLGVVAGARPGGKNGWTPDGGGWAVATVGFLGPAERYTVAVMSAGPPGGDFAAAVATVTGTVTTLFLGVG